MSLLDELHIFVDEVCLVSFRERFSVIITFSRQRVNLSYDGLHVANNLKTCN